MFTRNMFLGNIQALWGFKTILFLVLFILFCSLIILKIATVWRGTTASVVRFAKTGKNVFFEVTFQM